MKNDDVVELRKLLIGAHRVLSKMTTGCRGGTCCPETPCSHCRALRWLETVSWEDLVYRIPMFLGDPTETDDYELFTYMAQILKCTREEFRVMNDEFDTKFLGYRRAARLAQKELQLKTKTKTNTTLLECFDRKFRASNDEGRSAWYSVDSFCEIHSTSCMENCVEEPIKSGQ